MSVLSGHFRVVSKDKTNVVLHETHNYQNFVTLLLSHSAKQLDAVNYNEVWVVLELKYL